MSSLENKEILSDEVLNAIDLIIKQIPDVVFGGSISLNAIGLMNRPIGDIDLFFRLTDSLSKNGFLSILNGKFPNSDEEGLGSDTAIDMNGNTVQKTSAKILDIKVCCFKVSDEALQCSKHKFIRNGIEYNINIQNVNYAIEAKKSYNSKYTKHKLDLENISNELGKLFE